MDTFRIVPMPPGAAELLMDMVLQASLRVPIMSSEQAKRRQWVVTYIPNYPLHATRRSTGTTEVGELDMCGFLQEDIDMIRAAVAIFTA